MTKASSEIENKFAVLLDPFTYRFLSKIFDVFLTSFLKYVACGVDVLCKESLSQMLVNHHDWNFIPLSKVNFIDIRCHFMSWNAKNVMRRNEHDV